MKIRILALCTLLAATVATVSAQTHKNEVSVMYGAGSIYQIRETASSVGGAIITYGLYDVDYSYTGAITAQYLRYVTPGIAVGGSLTYENSHSTNTTPEEKHNFYTVMGNAKFMWFNKKYYGMYTRLGLGVTYEDAKAGDADDSATRLAFQASAIGIEVGTEQVRGFLELGVGTQGLFLAGVRLGF